MRRVFVYGTLRVGMYNYEYYYKAHDTFRRYAYVKGSLHAIRGKAYPALTIGDEMVISLQKAAENAKKMIGILNDMKSIFS